MLFHLSWTAVDNCLPLLDAEQRAHFFVDVNDRVELICGYADRAPLGVLLCNALLGYRLDLNPLTSAKGGAPDDEQQVKLKAARSRMRLPIAGLHNKGCYTRNMCDITRALTSQA